MILMRSVPMFQFQNVISWSLHPTDVLVWLHRSVVMTQILGNWSEESGYFSVLIY